MPKTKYWNGSAWVVLDAKDADTLDSKTSTDFEYAITKNASAPSTPTNGMLWIDITSSPYILKYYKLGTTEWINVGTIAEVTPSSTNTLTNKTLTSPKINEDVVMTATATELNVLDGIPATLTAVELGYSDGVTSAIQTQLNTKVSYSDESPADPILRVADTLQDMTATVAELNVLDGITATVTELNYVDGVTSAIQTQLNEKAVLETSMTIALSDEATAITTGTAKVTMRAPFAITLTKIPRISLNTASSSGLPAVDIKKNGTTIFSTTMTINATEKTSVTATTAAVLSVTSIADDDELTFDITTAGTGAKGLKVTLFYRRT